MSGAGPDLGMPGRAKVYRGSRKRLRRIKWYEHTPVEVWILVVLLLVVLCVVISTMIHQLPHS
jgi:hypothetical protein